MRRRANLPQQMCLLLFVAVVAAGCTVLDPEADGNLVPRTVTDDSSLPSYTLDGAIQLHLETFGDEASPVIIVLHGGPGGDYRSYLGLSSLQDRWRLVFWDQRGAGLSQRCPESELNGPRYLADLDELGRHFSPTAPFILLGHSWGGEYAVYYTQHYPDRVSHLVLIEPGPLDSRAANASNTSSYSLTDPRLNRFLEASDTILPDSYAEQDYYYAVLLAGTESDDDYGPGEERGAVPFWRLGMLANRGINNWQGNFDEPSYDFLTGLDRFGGPILVIAGTGSKRLGVDFQRRYHLDSLPRAEFVALPDAGHYIPYFRPDEAVEAIRAFLADGAAAGQ